MINGQKYIGMVHIEYSLLIFNIEENINNKLYYNYGNYFKDNIKLLYFSGNKQITFCPFIKIGDKCINNLDNDKFSISLNEDSNLYNNIKTTTCGNKNVLDYYCLDNCPNGFINSEGICEYCVIDNNIIFYIGTKNAKIKANVIMNQIVVHAMIVKIQKIIKFIINIIVFIVVNKFMDKKIKMKQMEVNIV